MTEGVEKEKKQGQLNQIRKESVEKISVLLTSAFGLVAALAWNTAIEGVFTAVFGPRSNLEAMILYAVVVTVIAVVVTIYVGRIAGRLKG